MFTSGSFCVFFKEGPLAWDGIIAWYLPLTFFAVWSLVNSGLVLRAIDRSEGRPATGGPVAAGGAGQEDLDARSRS